MRYNEDKVFKVKLIASQSKPMKIKLNKVEEVIDVHGDFDSSPEDVYYDDVVYYDGGGVEGYGYET